MRNDELLAKVSPEFKAWMKSRVGMARYPEQFRKEMVDLMDDFTVTEIEEVLGVNKRSLHRWKRASEGPQDVFGDLEAQSKEVRFVEIDNPAAPQRSIILELRSSSGDSMVLSNLTSLGEVKEIVRLFLRERMN